MQDEIIFRLVLKGKIVGYFLMVDDGNGYKTFVYSDIPESTKMLNHPIIFDSVEQYSGIKDSKGKNLFVGDRVRWNRKQGYTGPNRGAISIIGWFDYSYCGFGFNKNMPLTVKKGRELTRIGRIGIKRNN